MGARINIKLDRSLRENAGLLLPDMFNRMMSYRRQVAGHPEAAGTLHEMRIAGRPMRYLMEAIKPAFGGAFAKRLSEVKQLLDLAGLVHDADVMIGMLESSLHLLKQRAAMKGKNEASPAVNRTVKLLMTEQKRRAMRFEELSELLKSWNKRKFKKKLLSSIQ